MENGGERNMEASDRGINKNQSYFLKYLPPTPLIMMGPYYSSSVYFTSMVSCSPLTDKICSAHTWYYRLPPPSPPNHHSY